MSCQTYTARYQIQTKLSDGEKAFLNVHHPQAELLNLSLNTQQSTYHAYDDLLPVPGSAAEPGPSGNIDSTGDDDDLLGTPDNDLSENDFAPASESRNPRKSSSCRSSKSPNISSNDSTQMIAL